MEQNATNTSTDPTIAPYNHHRDYDDVIRLFRLNTPTHFHPSEEVRFDGYLNKPHLNAVVVKRQGKIAGFGGFQYDPSTQEGMFSWAFIDPELHRQGLGTTLVNYRIQALKELGAERIIVRTSQFAHQFYEKLGFELKKRTPDYWAKGFDLYHMEIRSTP